MTCAGFIFFIFFSDTGSTPSSGPQPSPKEILVPMKDNWSSCFSLCLLLGALPLHADYKLVHGPDPADPMQAHIYKLDNGLSVYLSENREEPRFYAEIAVRAGSKHDPAETTGIAHYLEHMLFKGTDKLGVLDYERERPHLDRIVALYEEHFAQSDPEKRREIYSSINAEAQLAANYAIPNEIDKLYTAMGAKGLNAHTWKEETVYKVDLPANRLTHWAKIEAERFSNPVFRLFQTELETVYEEKNRSMDDKGRAIRKAVAERLYKVHPYRNTTLGSVEHLKNPSLKRMYEFYRTYYVPDNMAILISGDIDIEYTISLIDAEFSVWRGGKLPEAKKWKENKIEEIERVEVFYEGEEFVLLAFRTAPRRHRDAEALQILDMILDNSVAGLININLNQRQKVRQAGSYPWLHNDYGSQYLWGIPKQGQSLREVEELLIEQIKRIKEGKFEDWIITAIITDFKKNHKQKLEDNHSRVGLMRDAFLSYEEWKHVVRTLERMEELEKKDIVKVAKKYFKDGYVAGYRRDGQPGLPAIEKPPLDKIEIDPARQSAFFDTVIRMPYEEIEPVYVVPGRDYETRKLRPGIKLYYAENPLNDLFSFSISTDVGSLADRRLNIAREFLDKSGTAHFSPEDLKKEWYKLGTEFSINVGDHETTVSIAGLDENFGASLALAVEFLQRPAAEEATLEELISIILKKRADAQKDNRTISQALYQYNRWGDQAYYRRILSNAELQELRGAELHNLIGSLLTFEHTLSYTGSLTLAEVLEQLGQHYRLEGGLQPPPPYRVLEVRRPEANEIYFFDKEMTQALVRIESGDDPYDESRRPLIQLYNEYFAGGMAGIVFQELREARALAYSAGARYIHGKRKAEPGIMVGAIGCQADKSVEAVEVFIDLIDRLPVSPERFEAARQALVNDYRTSRLGFRRVLDAVRTWERQEVPVDPRARRFEQIQRTSLDEMLEFHREHIRNRPRLISIVGDRGKIDLDAMARHGRTVELNLEDIFGF